jgi:hypothetical protein
MDTRNPLGLALAVLIAVSGAARADDLTDLKVKDAAKQGAPAAAAGKAVWATTSEHRVDTLPQFPDPSERQQCSVGSCHTFSTVSILEAAYFRAYGEHVTLSEADVFIRRTVLSKDLYDTFCKTGKCELSEGNDVVGDVKYALENGVASSLKYKDFLDRYLKYRDAEQKTLEGLERDYQSQPWYVKLLYNPRTHWAELQQEPTAKRIISNYLSGRDPALEKERAEFKKKFAGFKLQSKDFDYLGTKAKEVSAADCAKNGAKQKSALLDELKAHRPVSVSMSLIGLKEWDSENDKEASNHAFAIVGFNDDPKEGLKFETRNSWGGQNPAVPEAKLCRIYSVVTIRTPADK